MRAILLLMVSLVCSAGAIASDHNVKADSADVEIGTVYLEDGTANPIIAGDTTNQQIWVDYIQAHNDRDLTKIAEINAEDWLGYPPDGSVITGNSAHIDWLDAWFKTSDNPKWKVKWMIANSGMNDQGDMEHWLTTGNDITFNGPDGDKVTEHHVHDVQFVGNQIKLIYVYSRPAPE